MFKKLTPILYVEAIEPCLPYWTEMLGFDVVASVPFGDAMGFAILSRDGIEVMYQTRASAQADHPEIPTPSGMVLYFEVDALEAIIMAVPPSAIIVPVHTTAYGSTEFYMREPGGNTVGFAVPAPQD